MLRHSLALLSLVALAGCSSDLGPTANDNTPKTMLAATAGGSQYPVNAKPSTDWPLTALINSDGSTITLINPTNMDLHDIKVWVNGAYVQHVDQLPPHSLLSLKHDNFFNNQGVALPASRLDVKTIDIQTSDNQLHMVHGPVVQ